ncbi:hypothetical protein L6164_021846 [Bauhinia variegata]|uniref:Uncharacterized protein n=1 Tax=Bauhinia variegata TaxID=167791 RepID=A0ACB9MG61_BAUVA|nr:hypothetical protein L6164_021846 [Bauhinia variegata]
MEMRDDDGCSTPKRWECRIPTPLVPPPPPKKKPFSFGGNGIKKREAKPKNGYFQVPDHLKIEDLFFPMPPTRT